jgi:predicted nucleic acid-binding protein
MACLADTNVAARWVLPDDPQHELVNRAVSALRARGEGVYVTPQNLLEFHALATRPLDANGLGMTSAEARAKAQEIEAVFPLLPDTAAVYPLWCELVDRHGVLGRQVYDARLVAVMLAHGVTRLLTLNPSHFGRFREIEVLQPAEVIVGPGTP